MREVPQLVSIDNVNCKIGVRHSSAIHKGSMDNNTTGFVCDLCGIDILPDGYVGILSHWWNHGRKKHLMSSSIVPTIPALEFFDHSIGVLMMDVLQKYFPNFHLDCSVYWLIKHVRKLKKENTEFHTFGLMDIEQGTITGNRESLQHVVDKELTYTKDELIDIYLVVSSDQLTMDRYQHMKQLYSTDNLGFQMDSVLPNSCVLHTLFNCMKMLLAIYLETHANSSGDSSSLWHCITILGRPQIAKKIEDLWTIQDFVDNCLDVFIIPLITKTAGVQTMNELNMWLGTKILPSGLPLAKGWNKLLKFLICKDLMFNSEWKERHIDYKIKIKPDIERYTMW